MKKKLLSKLLAEILKDCENNPEKLYVAKEVWDKEWDELLKDVDL